SGARPAPVVRFYLTGDSAPPPRMLSLGSSSRPSSRGSPHVASDRDRGQSQQIACLQVPQPRGVDNTAAGQPAAINFFRALGGGGAGGSGRGRAGASGPTRRSPTCWRKAARTAGRAVRRSPAAPLVYTSVA